LSRPKTFLQQAASLLGGNLMHALSQFGLLLLLAKFGGKEAAGNYVLGLSITAPIFLFFDLNLRVARATDHQHGESFSSYLGLRAYGLMFAFITSLIVCGVCYPEQIWIVLLITGYRVGDSISNISYGNMQRVQQTNRVGSAMSTRGLLYLAAIFIVIPLTSGNEFAIAAAMGVIAILWALLKDLPQAWKLGEESQAYGLPALMTGLRDLSGCRRITKRTLALGFDAGLSSLALNVPKYCVEFWGGAGALGVFGLLTQMSFAIQKIIGAMGHTGVPMLSRHFSENKPKAFWRLHSRLLISSFGLGVISIVAGTVVIPVVLGWYLGASFANHTLVLLLLLASAFTGVQRIAGRATQACGQYLSYTLFDVLIFFVSATASVVLVKSFGPEGGAAALALAFLIGTAATLIHTYWFLWPSVDEGEAGMSE